MCHRLSRPIGSGEAEPRHITQEARVSESVAWRVVSRAILFTIAVLIGLWFLIQIGPVIVRLVLAVILAAGMKPLVDRLTSYELRKQGWWVPPRGLVVLVVYLVTILLVMLAGG